MRLLHCYMHIHVVLQLRILFGTHYVVLSQAQSGRKNVYRIKTV